MKCFIDEIEVKTGVGSRSDGGSGHWRARSRIFKYRYEMTWEEFYEKSAKLPIPVEMPDENANLDETVRLDLRLQKILSSKNFSSLNEIIDKHPELLSKLMLWIDTDVNYQFSDTNFDSAVNYSVFTLDWFDLKNENVCFGGDAYEMLKPN